MCKRINYKIVPLTNLNRCLRYGVSGTEECVYKYRYTVQRMTVKNYEQKKNTATSGKLIKVVYASYFCVYLAYILALRKGVLF